MDIDKLQAVLSGEPSYRQKQARQLVYKDLIADWNESTTLPLKLRERLNLECPLDLTVDIFGSQKSESTKILLHLQDGEKVESVLLRHGDGRRTVCVSAQAGCALGCKFCATGALGFRRNLSVEEIVAQVLFFARYLRKNGEDGERVSNVVFMGMGEPLLNYDNVLGTIRVFNDKDAFNIGARRISISTCGIIEGIERLMREELQVNLAISLHGAEDELRTSLMPINKRYPLRELMRAVDRFARVKNREVMFEYLLIKGVNDREEDARNLSKLMRSHLFVVNLIRYNPTGSFQPSGSEAIGKFKEILQQDGVNVTQRYSFGQDINAACGQLANRNRTQVE
jgi:23S rRNA (adenine2503-C2)-methyltransferase